MTGAVTAVAALGLSIDSCAEQSIEPAAAVPDGVTDSTSDRLMRVMIGRVTRLRPNELLLPLLLLLAAGAPRTVGGRQCPQAELEGIRRDCFYDFEGELSNTPPRSFHVLMEQKCNDSMLEKPPIMSDCVRSRIESHGCGNAASLLRRLELVELAHSHLCSARLSGRYCRELPKNLPHYVNLCVEALFDGITQSVMCSRSQMTVQKSQACVQYILSLMGSPCYYLQFNFYHIRNYAEGLLEGNCEADTDAASRHPAVALALTSSAAVAAALLQRLS